MAHASCLNIQDYYGQQSAEVFFSASFASLKKAQGTLQILKLTGVLPRDNSSMLFCGSFLKRALAVSSYPPVTHNAAD